MERLNIDLEHCYGISCVRARRRFGSAYTFKDGAESVAVERETLIRALSQGEKKPLYILNIIFEIELRRQRRQETLLVVDD